MNYFIGIDGGATKSQGVITDFNNHVIFKCKGGPTNFLASDLSEAADNLFEIVCNCKNNLQINDDDIASLCIGTAGAGREEDADKIKNSLKNLMREKNCEIANIALVSDVEAALEGAFKGNPGIILIAGTGSICYAKNSKGEILRVGGYGRLLGDEGSGYSLGKKALQAALRSLDGRCLPTKLTENIFSFMEAESTNEVIKKVYSQNFNIASLAEVVIKSGEENDESALNILEEESEELLLHLFALLPKLKEDYHQLTFGGSLLTNQNLYSSLVRSKIEKTFENLKITEPEFPPEVGAAFLARKRF